MADHEHLREDPGGRRGWTKHLTWPVLLGIGWLIYELTHKPALGAMAVCLKFGLSDFRTARWLSRIDTDRGRGHSCFWLFLATGLYKTAMTGTVLAITLTMVAGALRPRGVQPPAQVFDWVGLKEAFIGAALTTLGGFILSVLVSHIALVTAMRNKVKLWLDGEVHRARKENVWPSCYPGAGRHNRAEFPIIVSLIFTLGIASITTLIGTTILLRGLGGWSFLAGLTLGLFVFGGGLRLFLRGTERFRRDLFARSPQECWGVPELEEG